MCSSAPEASGRLFRFEVAINRRLRVITAFAFVYVFWGSTYLGIRIAVDHVPPILMAGARFSLAGTMMLAFCAATGRSVAVDGGRLLRLSVLGLLMLGFSNAVLAWAELAVPTGLAALIIAIVPIWVLLIERFVLPTGERPPAGAVGGVALGAAGVVVLVWPALGRGGGGLDRMELVACLSLLASSFCWSYGSVLSRRWQLPVDPLVASGWQMTAAGVVDLAVGLALGQHRRAAWTPAAITAIAYLVVFGSWVGFSAYVWLLRHVPTAKVATYAYVNPVVAVLLGWAVLGESVDRYIVAGAAIILPAVALVTRAEHPPADGPPLTEAG
jgi:drug/metabolite transporter (DMT)-like permease